VGSLLEEVAHQAVEALAVLVEAHSAGAVAHPVGNQTCLIASCKTSKESNAHFKRTGESCISINS